MALFVLSVQDGVRTTLFCAASLDAVESSGKFHVPLRKVDGRAEKRLNEDEEAVKKMWEESERMLRERGF